MSETMNVRFGFLGGNLVTNQENLDVRASCHKYATMCEAALSESFPGAEVEVTYQWNASGSLPRTMTTKVDGETDSENCQIVTEITERIRMDGEWEVYEEAEEQDDDQDEELKPTLHDDDNGSLYDADTNDYIDEATKEQHDASYKAGPTGIIRIDEDGNVLRAGQDGGRYVYVK